MKMTHEEYEQLKTFYLQVEEQLTLQDYRNILDDLNIPIAHENNIQWRLHTGCHNIDSTSGGINLSFHIESKKFTCFSQCNCSYNIYTLVQQRYKVLGLSKTPMQSLKYVCNIANIPFNYIQEVQEKPNVYNWKQALKLHMPKSSYGDIEFYDKSVLRLFKQQYHEDWIEGGISIETQQKYGIRWYEYRNQIVIPVYDAYDNLVGVRIRNMNQYNLDNECPKYMPLTTLDGTCYKFPIAYFLFGINHTQEAIKKNKKMIVFEAEKSVMQLDTWYGDSNYSVAFMGHSFNDTRLREMLKFKPSEVIIGLDFDFDNASPDDENYLNYREKCLAIARALKNYCKVTVICTDGNHQYNDSPVDNGKEWFEKLLANRKKVKI